MRTNGVRPAFVLDSLLVAFVALFASGGAAADDAPVVGTPEVIILTEPPPPRPAVPARPTKNWGTIAPPYSDDAIEHDTWAKAWMLLDVDRAGVVSRFKFLAYPGHDLEPLAAGQIWKLRFQPARDATGRATRTWILWSIEWPSYWWVVARAGTVTRIPPTWSVPCRGTGPMKLGSVHPVYRDCTEPDLAKAGTEPWIPRPE